MRKSRAYGEEPGEAGRDGDGGEAGAGAGETGAPPEVLDISELITPSLLGKMTAKEWKTKDEAFGEIERIIGKDKTITPNIGDLPSTLVALVTHANSVVVKKALGVCKQLAEAMGSKSRQHSKMLIPAIFKALGNNNVKEVRILARECLDVWAGKIGLASIFEGGMVADALKSPNKALLAELFAWLATNLPVDRRIQGLSFSRDMLACLGVVLQFAEGTNSKLKPDATQVFSRFMVQVGGEAMIEFAEMNLEPALKKNLEVLITKCKPQLPENAAPPPAETKTVRGAGARSKIPACRAAAVRKAPEPSVDAVESEENEAKGGAKAAKPGMVAQRQKAGIPKLAVTKRTDQEIGKTLLLSVNNLKGTRFNDEAQRKVLPWSFTTPGEEFVGQLRDQFVAAGVDPSLLANLFSTDLKMHLKALDLLMAMSDDTEVMKANLDLLLKWLSLRFFDEKPSVIIKGLEFVEAIFDKLFAESYEIHDMEIKCFVPHLLNKIGDAKEPIRDAVKRIIQKLLTMYPARKLFPLILDGLKSKTLRQRAECLDEMGSLIKKHGLEVCGAKPRVPLMQIADQIRIRDNFVRNAALNALVQAYFKRGPRLFKEELSELKGEDLKMLEERLKQVQKTTMPPDSDLLQRSVEAASNASGGTGRGGGGGGGGVPRPVTARSTSRRSEIPGKGEKFLPASALTGAARRFQPGQAEPSTSNGFGAEGQMPPRPDSPPRSAESDDDLSMSEDETENIAASSGMTTASSLSADPDRSRDDLTYLSRLIDDMGSRNVNTSCRSLCLFRNKIKDMLKNKSEVEQTLQLLERSLGRLVTAVNEFLAKSLKGNVFSKDIQIQAGAPGKAVELARLLAKHLDLPSVGEAPFNELVRLMMLILVDPDVDVNSKKHLNSFFSHSRKKKSAVKLIAPTLTTFRELVTRDREMDEKAKKQQFQIVNFNLMTIIGKSDFTKLEDVDYELILNGIHEFLKVAPKTFWEEVCLQRNPVSIMQSIVRKLASVDVMRVHDCCCKHPEYSETGIDLMMDTPQAGLLDDSRDSVASTDLTVAPRDTFIRAMLKDLP